MNESHLLAQSEPPECKVNFKEQIILDANGEFRSGLPLLLQSLQVTILASCNAISSYFENVISPYSSKFDVAGTFVEGCETIEGGNFK
jgi:hypothetical protein